MINPNSFPEVKSFFSAYFHQDWLYEYSSLNEALDEYCSCGESSDREVAVDELTVLLGLAENHQFKERDLLEFSCYYLPSAHNMSLSGWLDYLRKSIKLSIELKGAG